MGYEIERTIAGDHPSLAGHFPGNPLVPAVVIVEEVVAALACWCAQCRVIGVAWAKFVAPLRPDQAFSIALVAKGDCHIDFRCASQARLLASGRLKIVRAQGAKG